MKHIKLLIISLLVCAGASASAQTVREQQLSDPENTVGVYYLYPEPTEAPTKAPKGYKPFYISHYGRHGSRYMSSYKDYAEVLEIMKKADEAGALSEYGKDVYRRGAVLSADAYDRGGELVLKGVQQHRGIAERMFMNYPKLFKGKADIYSQSTQVLRCVLSMAAFNERLKEFNPKIQIERESGVRPTKRLNFLTGVPGLIDDEYNEFMKKGGWLKDLAAFEEEHLPTSRLMSKIFSDKEYASEVDDRKLMSGLLKFARSVRNPEMDFNFDDVFTAEELYWGSVVDNYALYVKFGPSPLNAGYPKYYAAKLLGEMIEDADEAIAGNGREADLRFGHDGNLMALLNMMEIEGCHASCTDPVSAAEQWPVYQITPMGANLQIIFFRKGEDVIVKFLHNERETRIPAESIDGVHYSWPVVRDYYMNMINSLEKPSL